jgi:hypothetical protein
VPDEVVGRGNLLPPFAHVRVVAARHPCAEEVFSVDEHVDLAVRSVARLEAQASGGAGPVNSLMAAITLVGRKEGF